MADSKAVVFVHGWSVTSTDTYGELPSRLEHEARRRGDLDLDVRNLWLSKYVSFQDEVRVEDLARAFKAAVERELAEFVQRRGSFACITHSTGGPVIRDWWNRYYAEPGLETACPMSHLIMLAPANFGSALAQLGKSRLSRLKTWFDSVEPGTGVLDWLELGSPESWELNRKWTATSEPAAEHHGPFLFVLTGQSIDRKLYDHVNSYTGETGSDGVVRVASANLNATYVKLVQQDEDAGVDGEGRTRLAVASSAIAPRTALSILPGLSHSGADMGILRSVEDDDRKHPTVEGVIDCLRVASGEQYAALADRFDEKSASVQQKEKVERHGRVLLSDTYTIHDRYAMLVFRLVDDGGHTLGDFDLLFTAGPQNSPDKLPPGVFADRQKNSRQRGTLTYFLNYDLMMGDDEVRYRDKSLRAASKSAKSLGLIVEPRPQDGFVHYRPAQLATSAENLKSFLKPNQTTLVEIVLRRVVRRGAFELTQDRTPTDFRKQAPGKPVP